MPAETVAGPVLFARYAFPPNQLGYCGPDDPAGFFRQGVGGDEEGLRKQARDFDGAWPLLTELAGRRGITDPLDPRVVEGYWLGGAELNHAYVVFQVYPWAAMLPEPRRRAPALRVLDRCRIRPATVVELAPDAAVVESRPLLWDGRLELGDPVVETVRRAIDGVALGSRPKVGDHVALHWDWLCDVITADQQRCLEGAVEGELTRVNERYR